MSQPLWGGPPDNLSTVTRSRSALPLALALLAPLVLSSLVPLAGAQGSQATRPQGEDWQLEPSVSPGEGFTVTATGTVEGEPARVERSFDLDRAELTIRYVLGDEDDPQRSVDAQLRIAGVYVFEDDGDGRLTAGDRIVDHRRVDPDGEAFVTPVRATQPLSAERAVVPLEDRGHVALTLHTASHLAVLRGEDLSATDSRLNLTVANLAASADRHAAIAIEAHASQVSQPEDALVHLDGQGASIELASMGAIEPAQRAGASSYEEQTPEGERALVLFAGTGGPSTSHEAEANVVHTSAGLADVQQAVRGEPGAFLLGLLAASVLVGATAWRKL